jgi:hypothetical protein
MCYNCQEKGHYANKCPKKKQVALTQADNQDNDSGSAHVTWHAATFETIREVSVNNAVDSSNMLNRNQILLDNEADVSIIHPDLLKNIKKADHELKINGVSGNQLTVQQTGYLPEFFQVYSSEDTRANVLCFADVEDVYPITYIPKKGFTVHMDDQDLEFERRGKLYVAEWDTNEEVEDDGVVLATTHENELNYTKKQVDAAKEAYQFVKNAGFPSEDEAIHLIEDGNLVDIPSITRDDVKRAFRIYGPPMEAVRGKLTQRLVKRDHFDETLKHADKEQQLYSDVVHIDSKKFLVTVCEPLQLTLQTPVKTVSEDDLGQALYKGSWQH